MKTQEKEQISFKSVREKHSKGELAKDILNVLAVGGILVAGFAVPNVVQLLDFFGATEAAEKRKILRAIDKMKQKRLIKIYNKNGRDVIEITESGKKKILSYDLENIKIIRPKNWDGYWRVVVFDIPEKYKRARRALSLKLNEMEFYPLQKSVFVCPFECKDEIEFVSEFFGVKKFITHMLAKGIENDEFLRNHYNL